jgi:hypothetical protein
MEKKYIQLIHNDLDGLLTPSERHELDIALKSDPELRKLYEDLHQMSVQLNQIPRVEPPPTLKKKILESINFNRYQEREAEQDWFVRISQWLAEPRFRLAYGLAAGIILGILSSLFILPGLITQSHLQIKDLYGTIGIHENDLNVIKELSVTENSFQGAFKVKSYWNIVGFEISFKTDAETEIQLEYDRNLLVFRGITTLESEITDLESIANRITLTAPQQGNFLILFEKLSTPIFPITLKVNQEGENILTQVIME